MESTRFSCQILMKLEFSRQIFEQISKCKISLSPPSGSPVVPCEQTDMKLLVAFRNFATAPKNVLNVLFIYIYIYHMNITDVTKSISHFLIISGIQLYILFLSYIVAHCLRLV